MAITLSQNEIIEAIGKLIHGEDHRAGVVNVTLEYRQIVIFMYNYVHEAE
jgi:hypothetical protein